MKRLLLLLPALAIAALVYAPPAAADDRICNGRIGAISTDDNIVVPSGASCRLEGTRSDGNVLVGGGGTLTALGVTVGGNIQAERHAAVTVSALAGSRSRIDGNIQLERGGPSRVDRADIDGNLQVDDANGAQIATANLIRGDLQAFRNRGGFEIRANRIEGNLQCSGNMPPPHGGQNAVSGDREGQCASLRSQPPPGGPGPVPGPNPPSLPSAGPKLSLKVMGGRHLRRVTRVRVRCNVSCTVRTHARIVLRRPSDRITLRVRPQRTRLAAERTRVIRLVLAPRRLRAVRRAIRQRGSVARLVVRSRATDRRGRADVERRVRGPLVAG